MGQGTFGGNFTSFVPYLLGIFVVAGQARLRRRKPQAGVRLRAVKRSGLRMCRERGTKTYLRLASPFSLSWNLATHDPSSDLKTCRPNVVETASWKLVPSVQCICTAHSSGSAKASCPLCAASTGPELSLTHRLRSGTHPAHITDGASQMSLRARSLRVSLARSEQGGRSKPRWLPAAGAAAVATGGVLTMVGFPCGRGGGLKGSGCWSCTTAGVCTEQRHTRPA